ncbi:MAG: tRNA lysidine(34) synthetase TilS, partial [Candidatus Coatesbacteria bacterium]
PGSTVLVAASGGPDSTALLYCLHVLAPDRRWRLAVAHLDHALRPDSAADAAFVRRQAAALGLPFFGARVAVRSLPDAVGRSEEEAARLARRSFLRRAARRAGADAVALGHTLDDQAETVLLNLTRGAGTLGLAGMAAAAEPFVRPLLGVTRADVLAYINARGLSWRDDPTNRDPRYLRNWFRQAVLPPLESRTPGIKRSLAALAAAARAEEEVLERRTASLLARLVRETGPDWIALAAGFPLALPEALRGRAVRRLFADLAGSRRGLERRHVEAVVALAAGETVNLPHGVAARRTPEGLTLVRRRPEATLEAWEAALRLPGMTVLPPAGVAIAATVEAAPDQLRGRGLAEVWLEARFASASLRVRSWREGDSIRPVGLGGRKKLHDLFVDAKVPAAGRRRWPVVVEGSDIIWVPALALAEGAAAAPGARAVRLRWEPAERRAAAAPAERSHYGL